MLLPKRTISWFLLKCLPGVLTVPALLVPSNAVANPAVVLTTHDLPPYSFRDADGNIDGLAGRVVACAFAGMARDFEIHIVPWKRAQIEVERGTADGFFAASRNAQRDVYAVMSDIIADQNWTWYLLSGTEGDPNSDAFRTSRTVSSFLGANMQGWLNENAYRTVDYPPQDNEALLDMLLKNRFDAILANDQVMDDLVRSQDLSNSLRKVLLRNKPLGVYFSKTFLASEPGFLEKFNAEVPKCRDTEENKSS